MNRNIHGLSRHIPDDIKLDIRRRSKFGCVICRCAIYQYEHIAPSWSNALAHDPNSMCLLCGGCHDKVTRGLISKITVQKKYDEIQTSTEIQRPHDDFDLTTNGIVVLMGSATFEYATCILRINGQDLLTFSPPRDGAAFPTLNGVFFGSEGQEIFRITENEWEGPLDLWDIQIVGNRISIFSNEHKPALILELDPPNKISVIHLDMYKDNCHVQCSTSETLIGQTHSYGQTCIGISNFTCQGAEVGISVDSHLFQHPFLTKIRIEGGKGILLDGTGIAVAVGSSSMHIMDLKIKPR